MKEREEGRRGARYRGLVACNHPGGARVVEAVVRQIMATRRDVLLDYVLTANSVGIFRDLPASGVAREIGEVIDLGRYDGPRPGQYDFILTGTSISGNVEQFFMGEGLEEGIPVFTVLDHWCEYDARFFDRGKGRLLVPDMVFVPDTIAREDVLGLGMADDRIVVSGHPAFDAAAEAGRRFPATRRDEVCRELGIDGPRGFVLFVSEPVEADHGDKGLGYNEFSIVERLCHSLSLIEEGSRPSLVVKLHPREKADKFEGLRARFPALAIGTVKDEMDRFDPILSSGVVLGMSSVMLLEAVLAGKRAFSILPEDAEAFAGTRLGWVPRVYDTPSIIAALSPVTDGTTADVTLPPGGAARSIGDAIMAYVETREGTAMESNFLQNEHITLRLLTEEYMSQEYVDWLNDEEVNRYSFRRFFPCSEEEARLFLRSLKSGADEIHFAVIARSDGKHIGNIGLKQINWQAGFAELGILIGSKEHWGKGFGSQAIRLLTEYAFNRLRLNRVEMGAFNPAAIRAFAKAGWKQEGIHRQRIFIDGTYYDEVRMAIIASDFYG